MSVPERTFEAQALASGMPVSGLELPAGMRVSPTGGPVGAVVRGVELAAELGGETIAALLRVFNHAGVVILPAQERLGPERQAFVTEWFGRGYARARTGFGDGTDRLPNVNDSLVTMLVSDDARKHGSTVPSAAVDEEARPLGIHSDVQDYPVPPDVTILHGVDTPPPHAGGSTYFYNLYLAYERLDAPTKERLAGLKWRPRTPVEAAAAVGVAAAVEQKARLKAAGGVPPSEVRHPVVRTHPVSGRKALWISPGFLVEIDGIADPGEERALRERLLDHVCDERYCYKHAWTPHDVLIWDNRCVNHRRDGWDPACRREMHRSQAGGSRPF